MKGLINQLNSKQGRPVIFIRHDRTEMNDSDEVRGWTDIPLDEDTHANLEALGKGLKGQIDGIITCNLLRTLQTALCVSRGSDAPILKTDDFLRTWNVGGFTGMPTETADPLLEKLATEEPDKTIEDGESFNEFKFRFLLGLVATLNQYPDKTLAFVAHGRNLAILNSWALMDYNDELEIDPENIGYDAYDPGEAHLFHIESDLLI